MDRPRPRNLSSLTLATQQLKLRSLTKIQGCNIQEVGGTDTDGLVYYSLHYVKDEPAIYCSEPLPLHLQRQKWADIVCPDILKSNKNCICVKVWLRKKVAEKETEQIKRTEETKRLDSFKSALSPRAEQKSFFTNTSTPGPPDKLIFTWAVYFSGLILLRHNTDIIFSPNSLIFQLKGAYFSSSDRISYKPQEKLTPVYQRHAISTSLPMTPNVINSPQVSRSSSPVANECQNVSQNMKGRVMQINSYQNNVRSYDLNTLLRIQEKQRLRLQKIRECTEITTEVKHLSVRCITANELQRRRRTTSSNYSSLGYHHPQNHSMGRTLSILLSEQQHVEPALLLVAQKLQHQLETVRNRHELLLSEKVTYHKRNENLKSRLLTLKAAREELEKHLEKNIIQLKSEDLSLTERYQQHLKQLQIRRHVVQNMERRMTSLCLELQEIYYIKRNTHGFYTVCGVPFPSFDAYMNTQHTTNQNNSSSNISSEHISPLALSASLGYVAHLVQMISVILDQPLRNPIIHEGSRSRIQDKIKDAPFGPRDFPLYSRSSIPSKLVKYAIYLLNQNIAQLCFDITGVNCDLRGTIENLLRIFSTFSKIEQNSHTETYMQLRTHPNNRLHIPTYDESNGSITIKNENRSTQSSDEIDSLSKARSSNDVLSLNMPHITHSLTDNEHSQIGDNSERARYRCNRKASSYSDSEIDSFKDVVENTYSSSDSNIAFWRQNQT